jgi:hypothetical protein
VGLRHLLEHVVRSPHLSRMIVDDLPDWAAVRRAQRHFDPFSEASPNPDPEEHHQDEWQPTHEHAHIPGHVFGIFGIHQGTSTKPVLIAEALKQLLRKCRRFTLIQFPTRSRSPHGPHDEP